MGWFNFLISSNFMYAFRDTSTYILNVLLFNSHLSLYFTSVWKRLLLVVLCRKYTLTNHHHHHHHHHRLRLIIIIQRNHFVTNRHTIIISKYQHQAAMAVTPMLHNCPRAGDFYLDKYFNLLLDSQIGCDFKSVRQWRLMKIFQEKFLPSSACTVPFLVLHQVDL